MDPLPAGEIALHGIWSTMSDEIPHGHAWFNPASGVALHWHSGRKEWLSGADFLKAERLEKFKPIEFQCRDRCLTTRGYLYTGPSPIGAESREALAAKLIGQRVEFWGRTWIVKGVESFLIGGPYPKGMAIGLFAEQPPAPYVPPHDDRNERGERWEGGRGWVKPN